MSPGTRPSCTKSSRTCVGSSLCSAAAKSRAKAPWDGFFLPGAFLRLRKESQVRLRQATITSSLLLVAPGVGQDLCSSGRNPRGARRRRRAGKRQPGAQTSARSRQQSRRTSTVRGQRQPNVVRGCARAPNLPPTSRPTTTFCGRRKAWEKKQRQHAATHCTLTSEKGNKRRIAEGPQVVCMARRPRREVNWPRC